VTNLYVGMEVPRRRSEFFSLTFDEMVEKVLTLEAQLEERTDERDELIKMVADLEAEQ